MNIRHLLAAAALAASTAAHAEPTTRSFTGYGYELESGTFRYTEHHTQTLKDGKVVDWSVEYRQPDGSILATKWLKPGAHPAVPEYRLTVKTNGYIEGIRRIDANTIELIRQKPDQDSPETKTIDHDDTACADSGFDAYLRQNWDAAMSGRKLKFDFIAAGRLGDYGFKAKRIDDTTFEGRRAVRGVAGLPPGRVHRLAGAHLRPRHAQAAGIPRCGQHAR